MTKILITGATGFIGSHLTCHFVDHRHLVHALIRPAADTWRLKGYLNKIRHYPVDLRQSQALSQLIHKLQPQVIIHAAAAGIYRNRHANSATMIDTNLKGTINLIEASQNLDYQAFIHTGSSVESAPRDIYSVTKLAATQFAQITARRSHKPIVVLRLFSPYGPLDDPRRLIPYAIGQANKNRPLKLANPAAVRDYIYSDDVIAAYVAAVKFAAKFSGEIFNIGSGHQTSVKQVVDNIIRLTRSKSRLEWNKAAPSDQDTSRWQADITKTKHLLRWQPKISLIEGLNQIISQIQK